MNCPSRTDEPEGTGFNQNPSSLSADLTTRQDLNGMANARVLRRISSSEVRAMEDLEPDRELQEDTNKGHAVVKGVAAGKIQAASSPSDAHGSRAGAEGGEGSGSAHRSANERRRYHNYAVNRFMRIRKFMVNFARFIGPGFMISVAYIDPGNYATDVAAGASYRFKLLFIVLMSNIFAIFLQTLCIKLGSISGLNLAEACRAFLPGWLNIMLYVMAEGAIIATDIAEVIGTAIAINLLIPQIPLVAGPNGSMKGLRAFEFFVMALVLGVVVCFCIQLSLIKDTSIGEVFRGYLPSSAIVQSDGLYQSCGILGATVMPHSLYLGSGIVQPRLLEYDVKHGLASPSNESDGIEKEQYYPSLPAINFCLKYSIAELTIALFTFALFVNSAILITAGASLSSDSSAAGADLFGIYSLLSSSIAPAAGTIFALALLLSGISAGIVCTIAGQMVSEGALNWTIKPWLRRLITRSISITPSIIIAGAVGRSGLNAALNGSQVALSVVLPFVTAPLIYFTCRNKYMTVRASHGPRGNGDEADAYRLDSTGSDSLAPQPTKMRNNWFVAACGIIIWLVMAVMNVANLVLLGKGQA
ncbi:Transporter protein Smf2 [Venustampulla echinocandica]|uniref:Transporter protein Smf2 n=1 Tax=Venustampulla echinocandica TaxID=2656787 RepID=A0A370TW09_9HELO|nr:Transporter protein Smf2 [Venustampulla echinocandica]RDL39714.1 Transporter protein Smf2 [Venustampulla echinocandica]